jgi:hypothetical protein
LIGEEEFMSFDEELASLSHDDLVKLSSLVYKLLKWDCLMTWEEALRQAYRQVVEESEWGRGRSLEESFSNCCECGGA